jgi:hypothetical protein
MSAFPWTDVWEAQGTFFTTVFSTAFTAATRTPVSTEWDNSVAGKRKTYGLVVLETTNTQATAGGYVGVYGLTAPDGTNYVSGSTAYPPPAGTMLAVLPFTTAATNHRIPSGLVALHPAKYTFLIDNQTGAALSSGTLLKVYAQTDGYTSS